MQSVHCTHTHTTLSDFIRRHGFVHPFPLNNTNWLDWLRSDWINWCEQELHNLWNSEHFLLIYFLLVRTFWLLWLSLLIVISMFDNKLISSHITLTPNAKEEKKKTHIIYTLKGKTKQTNKKKNEVRKCVEKQLKFVVAVYKSFTLLLCLCTGICINREIDECEYGGGYKFMFCISIVK